MNHLKANTMLPLPLNCYDELGRVKPPKWVDWACFFGARVFLVMGLGSLLNDRQIVTQAFSYDWQLWSHSVLGILYILYWLSLGRRLKLSQSGYTLAWIKPLLLCLVVADFVLQLYAVSQNHWKFEWFSSSVLLVTWAAMLTVLFSRHFRLLQNDWKVTDDD